MAKAALRAGGDINTCNDVGNTPLHFCFAYGYGDTLGEYLIQKGGNDAAANKWGKTPVHVRANPQFMDGGGEAPAPAPAASSKSGGMWGFLRGGSKAGSSAPAAAPAAAAAAAAAAGGGASVPGYSSIPAARPSRGASTPDSAAAYMRVEGHRDDGRSESHKWQLASQMLSEDWPWRTMATPEPLGLTYLMRCEQVAWRVDDGKRIRWMP